MKPAEARYLDRCEKHPLLGFFDNTRLTDGKLNWLLVLFSPMFVIGGALTGRWGLVVLGIPMAVLVPLNYRRYRQRLFHALADRDRPPGSEPVHPDAR